MSRKQTNHLVYFVFDLLHLDGWDLRKVHLEKRKLLLRELLARDPQSRIQYVDHIVGNADSFLSHCRRLELEGIVSKRRRGIYRSGRSGDWLKAKCARVQPFLIGGYTSQRGQADVRSLLLGYHDEEQRLIYAGRVGTGFSEKMLIAIEGELRALTVQACPFNAVPPREPNRLMNWVRPELVAAVRFTAWTADGILRHPSFAGLANE